MSTLFNPVVDQLYGCLNATDWFRDYALAHPNLKFHWPNKRTEPWKLVLEIENIREGTVLIYVYPHKPSAYCVRTDKTVKTILEIDKMIDGELDQQAEAQNEYDQYMRWAEQEADRYA